jgi:hypothetical protein
MVRTRKLFEKHTAVQSRNCFRLLALTATFFDETLTGLRGISISGMKYLAFQINPIKKKIEGAVVYRFELQGSPGIKKFGKL